MIVPITYNGIWSITLGIRCPFRETSFEALWGTPSGARIKYLCTYIIYICIFIWYIDTFVIYTHRNYIKDINIVAYVIYFLSYHSLYLCDD